MKFQEAEGTSGSLCLLSLKVALVCMGVAPVGCLSVTPENLPEIFRSKLLRADTLCVRVYIHVCMCFWVSNTGPQACYAMSGSLSYIHSVFS